MATTEHYSARNTDTGLLSVPLHWVRPSALNPRRHFDEGALKELAGSIRDDGLLEPIVVRRIPGSDEPEARPPFYEIIAGERRWRASHLAGVQKILIRNLGKVDDAKALHLALIENLQRQDLDPIEEAEGYRQLNRVVGLKQSEIAAAVNRSQPAIANTMRLLDLPEDVQERIRRRELSVAHGIALARFKDFPRVVSKMAEVAVKEKTPAKDLEKNVPFSWELIQAGVIHRLDYGVPFDVEQAGCEKCPFGAYRSVGQYSGTYCLNPSHFEELAQAARTAALEQVAEAREAGEVPKLSDLPGGSYCRIWDSEKVPSGCSASCTCRAKAMVGSATIEICTDPARWEALESAHEAAREAGQRALIAEKTERLQSFIDGLDEIQSRELAIFVVHAVYRHPDIWRTAFARHGLDEDLAKRATGDARHYELPAFQEAPVLALFKAALEAVVATEIRSRLERFDGDQPLPTFDWLLDGKLPTLPEWMRREREEASE